MSWPRCQPLLQHQLLLPDFPKIPSETGVAPWGWQGRATCLIHGEVGPLALLPPPEISPSLIGPNQGVPLQPPLRSRGWGQTAQAEGTGLAHEAVPPLLSWRGARSQHPPHQQHHNS